jgi:hypothetical protein
MVKTKKPDDKPSDKKSIEYGIGYLAVKLRQEAMDMRTATMNRYRDLIRRKIEGISFDKPEGKKTDEQKEKDREKYKDSELAKYLVELKKTGKLSEAEMKRINTALDMVEDIKALEARASKELIEPYVTKEELYYAYYKHIKGIGPTLTAEMLNNGMQPHGLKEDGTEKCPHVSSLRRYCMMDPRGAKGRKAGEVLGGNIKAKTLWWKIAKQMMMANNPTFMGLYNGEKARQLELMKECKCTNCKLGPEKHKRGKGQAHYKCKDGKKFIGTIPSAPMSLDHAHKRAIRWTMQKFITWHWIVDRQLNGYATDGGYIFEGAEKPHDLSGFIQPPYVPDILKDKNGQWNPKRPAGWIFSVGHKDWKDADQHIQSLCSAQPQKISKAAVSEQQIKHKRGRPRKQ